MMFLEGKQAVAQVPAGSGPAAKEERTSGITLSTALNGSAAQHPREQLRATVDLETFLANCNSWRKILC